MTTWQVGAESLPVAAAGDNIAWRDPTLVGLLDYFGFWIKHAIDDRLAELEGPTTSAAITDACPTGHRFPWNHNGSFMRPHKTAAGTMSVPLPGLWAWVVAETESDEGASLLYEGSVQREIKLCYVFPEVQLPDGFNARSGLMSSVARALQLAIQQRRHAVYGYESDANGTSILESLNLLGMRFQRGEPMLLGERPTNAGGNGKRASEGAVLRFFPAYELTLQVLERIGVRDAVVPGDVMGDCTLDIDHGEDVTDATTVLQRVMLTPPDVIDPTP